ncbi:cysteine dioxygenase [Paraburkholderia bonniea]|uniref:cysteine dioxygenase family protein n=1 Tax=Paraburkholderia bonniea TaxID=2152891 RepID=UPI0012923844
MRHNTDLLTLPSSVARHPHLAAVPTPQQNVTRAAPAKANLPLMTLCNTLDTLCTSYREPGQAVAFAQGVRAALASAIAAPALLTPAQREGAPDCYRRHLLAADPQGRYAIVALVWMPGQMSPVHGHQTWCGYTVLEGTLTETLFSWNQTTEHASAVRSHPRNTGAISFTHAGRGGIHQLGNASHAPAVSLHVYGVAGPEIATRVNDLVAVAESV